MNRSAEGAVSRRSIALLVAALLATFVTAIGTLGGFAHWNARAASPSVPTAIVQQTPVQHWSEEGD